MIIVQQQLVSVGHAVLTETLFIRSVTKQTFTSIFSTPQIVGASSVVGQFFGSGRI